VKRILRAIRIWWGGHPLGAIGELEAMRRAWRLARIEKGTP